MPREIDRLLTIMARLRNPVGGCPWDLEQSFATIAPHTIEEAYEVADAIEQRDMDALKDELGDLLFQVVYHAQMAAELGAFDFEAVAAAISDKMIRRHPHVFGTEQVDTAGLQTSRWEAHKAVERAEKAAAEGRTPSALDGVTRGLPALTRALKLQKRAARVGFEWTRPDEVLDKLDEETSELREELKHGTTADQNRITDELGDLLFVLVNLGRIVDVDPEAALRHANAKFERRFRRIEALLAAEGRSPQDADLQEMLALWRIAKSDEADGEAIDPGGPGFA